MRIRARALPPVVLAVALMAPGACGQSQKSDFGSLKGAQKDVAQAVYDLRDAVSKRDESKICDTYFTAALRDQVAAAGKAANRGSTCAAAIKDSIQDIDGTDLTVTSVQIEGTTATATIKTNVSKGTDPTDTLQLVNDRGWRISKLP
ncbi:MAG: hypothetical protein QOG68_588 [Solirubrobacteraceae bacterium]|jgi:copper chaperone CopZ|nr:hypothetical protein [Solirubrobacteraceae bacterium]